MERQVSRFWDWCNPHDDNDPAPAPTAADDVARVVGRKATLDLLANDLPGEESDADDLFVSEINGQDVGRRKLVLLRDEDSGRLEGFVKINNDGTVKVKAFPWFDGELDFTYRVSNGETESEEASVSVEMLDRDDTFTLNLLHFTDREAGAAAVQDAPNLSAVLNALRDEDVGADATLTLSSGDAFIPGLFYDASAEVFGSAGIADIQIQNELGVQAVAWATTSSISAPARWRASFRATRRGISPPCRTPIWTAWISPGRCFPTCRPTLTSRPTRTSHRWPSRADRRRNRASSPPRP